jgi:hypothetical protein
VGDQADPFERVPRWQLNPGDATHSRSHPTGRAVPEGTGNKNAVHSVPSPGGRSTFLPNCPLAVRMLIIDVAHRTPLGNPRWILATSITTNVRGPGEPLCRVDAGRHKRRLPNPLVEKRGKQQTRLHPQCGRRVNAIV